MTRKFWTFLVFGLSVVAAVPSFAQQRAGQSARRQQAKTSATASTNATPAADATKTPPANSATPAAPVAPAQGEAQPAPNAPGFPRERGGEGERRAPRMGGFMLVGVQMRAYQEAKGDGAKVSIDAFLTAFMKAVKEADADSDGKLSQEELQKLQESFRPNGPANGDANGRRGPRGGNDANEGAPGNGRRSRQNSTSYDESTTSAVVRAQEEDGFPGQDGPQGFPGQPGQDGSQGFPGQPGQDGPQGFPGQPGQGGPQGFPGQPGQGGPQGFPGQPGQGGPQRAESGLMKAINAATDEEDGSIDLSKLEASVKNALTEADADKDGSLDDSEWLSYSGFGGAMGGFGGMGGGFDMRRGARMRAMGVSMLQRQVQEKAQTEDGKIDVAKFRSEYLSLLKAADGDGDGKLNEEELQALQEKAMEEMRANDAARGQRGGFGGPGGGSPFDAMKNEDGKIDLSKMPESPFSQGMKAADKDGDGLLDEDELKALQEQMRSMMRQGGPNGEGFGGRSGRRGGNDSDNGGDRPQRGGFGVLENQNVIVRAQQEENQGAQGRQRGGMPGGTPGQGGFGGMPGMPGGMQGGPGGFGGMPGMGMGMGTPRGNSSAVQKAISKATQEDGTFVIATFDEELAKALENADNEDDGLLDQIEQEDAFGMPIMRRPEAGNRGDNQRAPRAGRDAAEGRPDGNERQGRGPNGSNDRQGQQRPNDSNDRQGQQRPNDRQMNDRFQAMRVPTPGDSFVGVNANPDFKFGKAREEGGSAEKSPIEADYAIGKYEVRNREYKEFVDATKRETTPKYWVDGTYVKGTKNCPVVGITLQDAQDYCDWLTSQNEDGWTFRLPTEAEFENAAAGSKKQRFPWGTTSGVSYTKGELTTNCLYNGAVIADLIEQDVSLTIGGKKQKVADVAKLTTKGVVPDEGWRDSSKKTGFTYSDVFATKVKQGGFAAPVNKYRGNESPYGCVGMAGNASEWTTSVVDGKNVVRGGSWYSSIDECAATWRGELKDPAKGDPTVGFRVVAEKN